MQIVLGLPEPREFSSLPRLRLVQAGILRTHAERVSGRERVRLPITPVILSRMKEHWDRGDSRSPDLLMLWAAAALCFHGFFRAGELTVPSIHGFDPKRHLAWGDIAVDNQKSPSVLRVHLKQSKTDQLGKGVGVFIGRTDTKICPVRAFLDYVSVRGCSQDSFFKFSDGVPLTKSKFTERVRSVLQELGLPYGSFAGHSFRIGAVTAAAKAGLEDSVIQSLGRWNSAAFLSYIRTPKEHLAQYSRLISEVNSCNSSTQP